MIMIMIYEFEFASIGGVCARNMLFRDESFRIGNLQYARILQEIRSLFAILISICISTCV